MSSKRPTAGQLKAAAALRAVSAAARAIDLRSVPRELRTLVYDVETSAAAAAGRMSDYTGTTAELPRPFGAGEYGTGPFGSGTSST